MQFILPRVKSAIRPSLFGVIFCLPLFALACGGSGGILPSASSTSSSTSGAEPFEGVITTRIMIGDDYGEMKSWIKGPLSRTETATPANAGNGEGVSTVVIIDETSRMQTTLFPRTKTYTKIGMDEIVERAKKFTEEMKLPSGIEETQVTTKITSQGKQETVAGYTCQHWLVENGTMTADVCLTKELTFANSGKSDSVHDGLKLIKGLSLDSKMAARYPEFEKFAEGGIYPIKMSLIGKGVNKPVSEVTGIERKSLDDSVFAIPPDFKQTKTPALP